LTIVASSRLNTPKIDELRIKLFAHIKPTNFVSEPDNRRTAARGEIQSLLCAEFRFVAQLRLESEMPTRPDCVTHILEDTRVESTADICAKTDGVAFVQELPYRRAAARDGCVAAGTMRETRSTGKDGLALFGTEVYGMR
jgi:hypothetical protein